MIPFDSFYIDTIDLLSKDKKNITSLMSLKTSFEWKIIYENIDLIDDDNIRQLI